MFSWRVCACEITPADPDSDGCVSNEKAGPVSRRNRSTSPANSFHRVFPASWSKSQAVGPGICTWPACTALIICSQSSHFAGHKVSENVKIMAPPVSRSVSHALCRSCLSKPAGIAVWGGSAGNYVSMRPSSRTSGGPSEWRETQIRARMTSCCSARCVGRRSIQMTCTASKSWPQRTRQR